MADAFDPPSFPPVAPERVFPPPQRWEFRNLPRYRRVASPVVPPNPLYHIWNDLLFWDDQYYWDE